MIRHPLICKKKIWNFCAYCILRTCQTLGVRIRIKIWMTTTDKKILDKRAKLKFCFIKRGQAEGLLYKCFLGNCTVTPHLERAGENWAKPFSEDQTQTQNWIFKVHTCIGVGGIGGKRVVGTWWWIREKTVHFLELVIYIKPAENQVDRISFDRILGHINLERNVFQSGIETLVFKSFCL